MAEYHEQATLDANYQRIASSSSVPLADGNVTPHDIRGIYDMDLVRSLLQSCLEDTRTSFWAKILDEHQINVTLTSVDDFRKRFIEHIYSGECVENRGSQCGEVVMQERWPQSMAIRMVDETLEWVGNGNMRTSELGRICDALGLVPSATRRKRSLMAKLVERRRQLLDTIDAAALELPDILPCIASPSSMKALKAVGNAHAVEIDTKESGSHQMLEHITHGECARGSVAAPGCDQLVKSAGLRREDPVYLQVAVLSRILEVASKKQLMKVLDLHGIEYGITDKKKKMRSALKKYIQKVERGKVKAVEAENDAIDRLQKLEEIRKCWPRLVPAAMKEKIIKDFRDATSSITLSSFTCACCARRSPLHERIRKLHTDVNLDLLDGPTTNWASADYAPPPTPFTSGPLEGKLIDAHGVVFEDGNIMLELCTSCSRGLQRRTLPKHALANRLYVGPVPDALAELTMVEESMVARARAKSWIVKLQEQDADAVAPTAQRGLKGHTIIYPQRPDKLAEILPPPVDETLTFICVIFVGSSRVTKEWLREKAKPLVVRREKVRNALTWLKANNPLYKDVDIDHRNLEELPLDDVLPYHVECVADSEAQEALVSRYDNMDVQQASMASATSAMRTDGVSATGPDANAGGDGTTRFESVVVADVDAHTPMNQLRAAAVRHAKTKGKPFVQVAHGATPMNEFFNVDLFPMLYPTLFPYGCGGFEERMRSKRISLKEHAKYLFSLTDRRFQTHHSFLFTVFNILQRRALLLGCSLKVKRATFGQFARSFSSVSSEAVASVLERIESGGKVAAETEEERKVLRLMKEVNLITTKVPGSSAARVAMRNEIRALTMSHGMPSFYVTINPADGHNPIVKFLAGADIDIDNMLMDDVPNYWEQAVLLSSNPFVGATFFNAYLKAFIQTVLGVQSEGENGEGILGVVKAHYGCVEAQGRGSLHCHMLIWIEGALNPNEIRDKVIEDTEWGKRLLQYLDDTITNVVPKDPIPEVSPPWSDKDPCTLRGVNLGMTGIDDRLALRMKDINRLAERVQRHRHSHTCYKNYKPGEARSCRFDLSEENFRATSCIEPDTGQISLRCLDGLVNNFNVTMLEAVRCNMDIQFIGSGESAKAMIYYVTDYITKSQLKSHVAYAALQSAVKKCEDVGGENDDVMLQSKRLLQKCSYAMISHQEMSAQQVVSYLMGYEDHFTSHSFSCLYWASFERFIERFDDEKLCSKIPIPVDGGEDGNGEPSEGSSAEDHNDTDDGNDGQEGEDDEEVAFRVDDEGNVCVLADQVADYTMRPEQVEALCLWDFVRKTEKVYVRNGGLKRMTDGNAVDDEERETGWQAEESDGEDEVDVESSNGDDAGVHNGVDEDSDGKGVDLEMCNDNEGNRMTRGRGRYRFLPGHKEYERRQIQWRRQCVVPVPIGPAMP